MQDRNLADEVDTKHPMWEAKQVHACVALINLTTVSQGKPGCQGLQDRDDWACAKRGC